MATTFDLSVLFRIIDKATAPVKKINTVFSKTGLTIASVNKQLRLASFRLAKLDAQMTSIGENIKGSGFFRMGERMTALGKSLSIMVTLPLVAAGAVAAKTAVDFESAFTGVRKTVEATEPQFEMIRQGLIGITKETPATFVGLSSIAAMAGQLGIETENIIGFTNVMADLGETTNLVGEEGATVLARFANITGMAQTNFDRLGSTIVDLGNNSATTEAEIAAMALRLAAAGNLVGLTESEILSMAATLSSLGVQAEAGGTAFSKVMRSIDKEIGTASDTLGGFAAVSGQTVEEFEKSWEENAGSTMLAFIEGLGGVEEKGLNVNQVLDALGFEGIRVSDSLLRAAGAGELFRETVERGNEAWEENTALTEEANLRYGTMASQFSIAKNRLILLANAFGEIIAPALLKVADILGPIIDWLAELGPVTKIFIVVLGALTAALGPALLVLGFMAQSLGAIITLFKMLSGAQGIGSLTALIPKVLALAAPFAAVALAIAAVTLATIQLVKHWDTLKQPGVFQDFVSWLSGVDPDAAASIKKAKQLEDAGLPEQAAEFRSLAFKQQSGAAPTVGAGGGGFGGFGSLVEQGRSFRAQQEEGAEANVTVTVSAAEGSEAQVKEVVNKRRGKINVNVFSEAYTGVN